ncbi:hypothetical protein EGJ12_05105 [Stutzerimonas stutzeri]|uniref:hypothetical protein n=1 Tax=Pseudomonadaceae TaxID=135621 RepID=UPI000EB5B074|nr:MULTISPECIES: hypothetical protein [Pseudomonadaceae]RRV39569.1 hypothetical protein EGJ12_05105 [Stutzerimonas stutzeri]
MAASWQIIHDKDDAKRPRCYIVRNDPRYERPMRLASFHSQVPLDVAEDVMRVLEAKLEARLSAPRGRE